MHRNRNLVRVESSHHPSRIDIFAVRSSTDFPNRQPNGAQPRAARLPNAVALTADICIFHNYIAIAQRTKPNPCFWEIKFAVDSGYAIILCWVGSKDQFCEIKFAFDSGFAIILCWPLVIIPFYRPWPRDSGPTRRV